MSEGPLHVLLDDDPLMHMTWRLAAKQRQTRIELFGSPGPLLEKARKKEFTPDTRFYLDGDLGQGQRGEKVAAELSALGYAQLWMASGEDHSRFAHLNFLKGSVGKDPPF